MGEKKQKEEETYCKFSGYHDKRSHEHAKHITLAREMYHVCM